MIRRRREPVYRTSSGFMLDLDDEQRHLLRRLIGEVRELITSGASDDAKMRRLFPPAYTDDEVLDTEYQRLMREELVASRLSSVWPTTPTSPRDPTSRCISTSHGWSTAPSTHS